MRTDFYIAEEQSRAKLKPLSKRAYAFIAARMPKAHWQDNYVILRDNRLVDVVMLAMSQSGLSFVVGGDYD